MDMAIFSLHLAGVSSIMASMNFLVTVYNMRATAVIMERVRLLV